MPTPKPRKPTDPTGVERDDMVYAAHPAHGPMVLKVLAAGRHGFTGEDGAGGRHKIRHEQYLGHKARALHTFSVVDQGVDGAILANARGERRYVGGELPGEPQPSADSGDGHSAGAKHDPLLDGLGVFKKALPPPAPLPPGMGLLFKALGVGRAGLTLRRTTDRSGRTEGRWVRTNPEQKHPRDKRQAELPVGKKQAGPAEGKTQKPPPALHKHGDTVAFRHGDVEGSGKIVASGQDGVTVQTEDGREHLVRHDALLPDHPPQPKTDAAPPPDAKPDHEDGNSLAPLFDEAETKGLPKGATQPVKTKEELYAKASEAQTQLEEWLDKGKGIAAQLGYEHVKGAPETTDMDQPGGMLFIAPVKSEKRATEKVNADYGGDWSQLLDPVRASIAVDSYAEVHHALKALTASGMKLARQPKDRFTKPLPVGYRDALLNITLPNGVIGELQLHVKSMLKAKSEGHHHYEVQRTIDSKPEKDISEEEHATRRAAIESQTRIYNDAWDAAQGKPGGETMEKALMAGEGFSFFEHDGAKFRRRNVNPDRWSVDDVLHKGVWKPYAGDRLEPAMYGDEIADPLGGGSKDDSGDASMNKAIGADVADSARGPLLLMFKATIRDEHQTDLFATPTNVHGHVRGTRFVMPYMATRHKASEHPAPAHEPKQMEAAKGTSYSWGKVEGGLSELLITTGDPDAVKALIGRATTRDPREMDDGRIRIQCKRSEAAQIAQGLDRLKPPPAPSAESAAAPKGWDHRILLPQSAHAAPTVTVAGRALAFTGYGKPVRISEDDPSVHGEHLLGSEGRAGRFAYYRASDQAPAPQVIVTKPKTPEEPEHLATGRKLYEGYKALQERRKARGLGDGLSTASDERSFKLWGARLDADPSKWRVGQGVKYEVASGGKGKQVNRGFRIVEIDAPGKRAVIRQVSDTGLTSTGGDHDHTEDMYWYLGELKRDKKYDAP